MRDTYIELNDVYEYNVLAKEYTAKGYTWSTGCSLINSSYKFDDEFPVAMHVHENHKDFTYSREQLGHQENLKAIDLWRNKITAERRRNG